MKIFELQEHRGFIVKSYIHENSILQSFRGHFHFSTLINLKKSIFFSVARFQF